MTSRARYHRPTREPWLARQARDRLAVRALVRVMWADGWPGRAFLATLASAGVAVLLAMVASAVA